MSENKQHEGILDTVEVTLLKHQELNQEPLYLRFACYTNELYSPWSLIWLGTAKFDIELPDLIQD